MMTSGFMLQLHEPGEGTCRAEDEEDEEEDDENPELEVQSDLSIKPFKEAIVSLEEVQKFLESRGYLEVSVNVGSAVDALAALQLHSGHYLTIFHVSEHHYHHYYHQQYYLLHLQRGEGVIKENLRRETNLSIKAKGYVPKGGCCLEVSLYTHVRTYEYTLQRFKVAKW